MNEIERAEAWLDTGVAGIRTPYEADQLIRDLLAVVKRLPVTADGVPMVDPHMPLWSWYGKPGSDYFGEVHRITTMCGLVPADLDNPIYSTREAAEAARESKQ